MESSEVILFLDLLKINLSPEFQLDKKNMEIAKNWLVKDSRRGALNPTCKDEEEKIGKPQQALVHETRQKLTNFSRLAGQPASETEPPVSVSPVLFLSLCLLWYQRSTLGPHAYTANSLPTRPSPQSQAMCFLNSSLKCYLALGY